MALNTDPEARRIFDKITNQIDRQDVYFDERETAAKKAFEKERSLNSFAKSYSYEDYALYAGEKVMEELHRREFEDVQQATAPQLWHTLLNNPFTNRAEYSEFCKFINTSKFPDTVELGKLYGRTPLHLLPGTQVLDLWEEEKDRNIDNLEYADHGGAAVEYEKGPLSLGDSDKAVPDKERLRRFRDIGYVFMQTGKRLVMTGHVMVIDLDSETRQPWLILAKTWTDDEDEPMTFTAPDYVAKGDSSTVGVFPGNKNRTTIAKVMPFGPSSLNNMPLLLQFGPECQFGLYEGGKRDARLQEGPALARVMVWRKGVSGQELCFNRGGGVYLTRDSRTGEYTDPQRKPLADRSTNAPRSPAGPSQRSPRRRA
ncbi:MAG: hypothetical protein LQ346_005818 [Caloplaca aetnensis]|nr:MAG: hypothetical protein LQ346_005818 [Caloplaca aetnensis]